MLMTHSEEDGTYEQRDKTKHSSRRPETMPGVTAGIVGAESLDKTVHCFEIRRFPGAAVSDSAIWAIEVRTYEHEQCGATR
jgi:hypothetical protein